MPERLLTQAAGPHTLQGPQATGAPSSPVLGAELSTPEFGFQAERLHFAWGHLAWDLIWLVFLAGLAILPPQEGHKPLILLGIGLVQIFERRLLGLTGRRGRYYVVLLKLALATMLLGHSGEINSSYYLIYFVPVVTAAMYFGPVATLLWTALASAAYLSYLIPALKVYELTPGAASELALRILFLFLAAPLVNRFVMENRRQSERYRELAERLAETNRQLAQAQAEARRSERLAALGQLSAGLAHEIRNPLGVIKGSAETLGRRLPPGDALAAELAGYISSEVNKLNALVSRFLDFARPLDLDLRPQEVVPLVDRALKAVHDRFPEAKVEVERQIAPALPAVSVDADLMEQVFTNLALNAYEAMGDKGGTLTVRALPGSSHAISGVDLIFADTGPGVPADSREQIFNPFFTTKKTGVGLGLSIVSKIVDEHHGWIRVEGEPGEGGRFRVFLPAGDQRRSG